ncbi:MAG: hypothetical protein H6838_03565 [Planctomycetes bacterium]|nr:hypothetical protein [Planctomycetota bacterium]
MTRVDALMLELQARHNNNDPRFLTAVRPLVERILDPGTPEDARVPLLEMLAETFERDVAIREATAQSLAAWRDFFANLKKLLGLE